MKRVIYMWKERSKCLKKSTLDCDEGFEESCIIITIIIIIIIIIIIVIINLIISP